VGPAAAACSDGASAARRSAAKAISVMLSADAVSSEHGLVPDFRKKNVVVFFIEVEIA